MGRLNMRQSFVDVLRSSADERRALFSAAASDLETRAENIEKDLYVCWVLDFLSTDGRTIQSASILRAVPASVRLMA
jgi:hypothetical protein